MAPKACPVCRDQTPEHFLLIDDQDYWCCQACQARFLDPSQLPTARDEHAHYLLHENDPDDVGYRKFLSKLAVPLLAKLGEECHGLDYGCGPGPALAAMLTEAGHEMALYDPFFHPDIDPLSRTYDFITCSETAEHFHRPAEEFERLDAMLRPGGWVGLMTCFQTDDSRFANWHYRKDPTHVVFYREATFEKIAAKRGWMCEFPTKDIALMSKS
jgi:hypothetical protein